MVLATSRFVRDEQVRGNTGDDRICKKNQEFCMSKERSVSRDGDKVYLDEENDGWTYMNRGPETRRTEIVSADEKGLQLVDGSGVSSSDGHLQNEAMRYFAEIANKSKGK
jgi:hypothetical protein